MPAPSPAPHIRRFAPNPDLDSDYSGDKSSAPKSNRKEGEAADEATPTTSNNDEEEEDFSGVVSEIRLDRKLNGEPRPALNMDKLSVVLIDAEGNDVGNGDIFDMMEIVADTREMTVDFITQQSSGSPLTTAMNSFIHELYDLLMGDLNPEVDASSYMDSLMRKTYLDHSYDAVGLQAMRLLSHDLEYEEMEELLNQGGSFIREDEGLASLLTYKKARAMEKTEGRVLFVKVGPEGNVLQQEEMDASECHDKRIGQGQYVLLDFWASWCGPCRDEIPNVIRLNNLFAEKGLRILGVTVRDQPDHSKAAISEMKINYDQIFDLEGIISARYSVEGVPHFFLLDPQGNVALQGHHNLDEFEQYLQKNL